MVDAARSTLSPALATEPLIPRKNDVLAELCRAIARSGNHREIVQESAARLQRYFGSHSVGVLFESEGDLLLEGISLPDHLAPLADEIKARWGTRPTSKDRPAVRAMRARQILHWDVGVPGLPLEIRALLERGEIRTIVAIPIYVDGDPIGVGFVGMSAEKPLTAADEALLETALGVVGEVYRRGVLKELEAEHQRKAIQSHQLAAVGELAAGMAHEINNPLNTIVHFSEVLLQQDLNAESLDQVRSILTEALRAAATVRSLQAFARGGGGGSRATRVEDAIQAIVDLEEHQLALSNIVMTLELEPELPAVRATDAHLTRVLHNVIGNARHAIHRAGAPGEIRVRASRAGRSVEIVVEDTGPGLTPEVVAAMFQPFFTTRPDGEGTGLGLAVAYGMVREHGGEIEGGNWGRPHVSGGAAGEGGARLVIRLPAEVEPWLPAPSPSSDRVAPARPLSILLVEDEPQVARSVSALLTRDGHRVALTSSAEEAVDQLRENEHFDVILSDLRMSGMGGEGLCDWIRGERPALMGRLLLMSGDLLTPSTQEFLANTSLPALAKPFTLGELRSALAPFAGPLSDPGDPKARTPTGP